MFFEKYARVSVSLFKYMKFPKNDQSKQIFEKIYELRCSIIFHEHGHLFYAFPGFFFVTGVKFEGSEISCCFAVD